MQAEIISIGDELLIGQTINSNSAWLGEQMNAIGIRVHRSTSIADSESEIIAAINEASARSQVVLMTGGLGPTKDDITKKTLCQYFNSALILNEESLQRITSFFNSRGLPMLDVNREQAMLPERCSVIQNYRGTACGMWFEKDDTVFISMPGVPYEMTAMMEETIIPKLIEHFNRPAIKHRTVLTIGVGESFLAKTIAAWEDSLAEKNIKLAYLPSPGMVKLRMSCYTSSNDAEVVFSKQEDNLRKLIGEHIYGYDKETLGEIIGEMLIQRGSTLSTAESCTGGYIGHLITQVAGCSRYYAGGLVAYHERIKEQLLSVKTSVLKQHGVVSEAVAVAMADGAKEKLGTDWGVASTGVAGPDGGSEATPVGTVWLAVAGPQRTVAQQFQLGKSRDRTIQVASNYALNLLRKEILQQGA